MAFSGAVLIAGLAVWKVTRAGGSFKDSTGFQKRKSISWRSYCVILPDPNGAIERSIILPMPTIALAKKHLKKLMLALDKRESSNEAKIPLIKNLIRRAHTL